TGCAIRCRARIRLCSPVFAPFLEARVAPDRSSIPSRRRRSKRKPASASRSRSFRLTLNARLRSEFASGGAEIDIGEWTNGWTGWVQRYLEDHQKLLAAPSKITPDWDWNDFLAPALQMGQFAGAQLGVPYRATVNVLHYQKALLEQVGFAEPPKTFDQLRDA